LATYHAISATKARRRFIVFWFSRRTDRTTSRSSRIGASRWKPFAGRRKILEFEKRARLQHGDSRAIENIARHLGWVDATSAWVNLAEVQFVGKNSKHPEITTNMQGNDLNNFPPAVGIAWNVPWFGKDKTALRSGYGISYAGARRGYVGVDGTIGGVPGINFGGQGVMYTPPILASISAAPWPAQWPCAPIPPLGQHGRTATSEPLSIS
jgi:hypothetical protein